MRKTRTRSLQTWIGISAFLLLCLGPIDTAVAQCSASYTADDTNCPAIDFTDASTSNTGNIVAWFWDFGDGGIANTQNPSYTYSANGAYVACLTILTSDSCVSTFCDTIVINCISSTNCNADYDVLIGPCSVARFIDQSTTGLDSIAIWFWDFGDGNTSTLQNPIHSYAANGVYVACLTITTANGCTSTYCDTLVINCPTASCQAEFTYISNAVQCPTVKFTDQSTSAPGTIVSWVWDFGDGNTSTAQSPLHTYGANGTYLACLTIFTSDSCTSTYCDTVVVNCPPPTCQAEFVYTLFGCPSVQFFDQSVSFPDSVGSWLWDFGDGNTSTAQNPNHTYGANGVYLACLTITTTGGCTSTYCDTLVINCPPASCQAEFTYISNAAQCPTVKFTDQSTSAPGTIVSWAWDFGDGNTSTTQSPLHTYGANGTYLACLTIFTSDSCISTYCDTVVVNCPPPTCQADFNVLGLGCAARLFLDQSTSAPGSIVSWAWDFGDGTTSSAQNPAHVYGANGAYVACLTIVTSDSCTSTYCDTVVVNCPPPTCQADFVYANLNCPTVRFLDQSSSTPGTIVSWSWDFGDGNTSNLQSPIHTYAANGTYVACLTIFTSDSCTSTYCDTVVINCPPPTCNANFAYTQLNCPTVQFQNLSMSFPLPAFSSFWDFGDGTTSNLPNPAHTYPGNGTYVACLTITTIDSCVSTYCDTILINCDTCGNVGICTDLPTERLDVQGNVRIRELPPEPVPMPRVVVADAAGVLYYRPIPVFPAQEAATSPELTALIEAQANLIQELQKRVEQLEKKLDER